MERINKYLASANTGMGFINYFEYIIDKARPSYIYVLKGGPGTGKSTLMKKINKYFSEKGEIVECFYCSSDISSLDAIHLVEKNIAVVDGTSPHICEINFPKVDGEIINLGDAVKSSVNKNKYIIHDIKTEKQKHYLLAYDYLKIANILKKYEYNSNFDSLYCKNAENLINLLIKRLQLKKQDKNYYERKLFLDYLDKGVKSLFEKNKASKLIKLKYNKIQNDEIINLIICQLKKLGYRYTIIYNIIVPEIIDMLLIDEISTVLINEEIDDKTMDLVSRRIANECINNSYINLKKAQELHKQIEAYYSNHIDFNLLDNITDNIIKKIEQL